MSVAVAEGIMLDIKNLHVTVDGKAILDGLTLSLGAGEVHAIEAGFQAGKAHFEPREPGFERPQPHFHA